MSKFTQSEETAIVKNAMDLTSTILFEESELRKTKAENFRSMPTPPKRKIATQPNEIKPQYPAPPKTTFSYSDFIKEAIGKYKKYYIPASIIAVILLILGFVVLRFFFIPLLTSLSFMAAVPILIVSFVSYNSKRNALNKQLAETPEYLQEVENAKKEAEKLQKEAEEKVRKEQEKFDVEYEKEKNHYETVIVPEYKEALDAWTVVKEKKISFLEEELKCNNEALSDLYDTSKLISTRYRELWILTWLYEDMSSSDHDIRYATELLDRERQRVASKEIAERTENAINDMKNTMEDGFSEVYNAIEYGNELQEKSIKILSKSRRDNNIANLVGTAQRHNTNKMLESLLPKKK